MTTTSHDIPTRSLESPNQKVADLSIELFRPQSGAPVVVVSQFPKILRDDASHDPIRRSLHLAAEGASRIILDLEGTSFTQDAIASTLLTVKKQTQGNLTLCNVSESGAEVLRLLGFHKIIPISSSLDEAKQAAGIGGVPADPQLSRDARSRIQSGLDAEALAHAQISTLRINDKPSSTIERGMTVRGITPEITLLRLNMSDGNLGEDETTLGFIKKALREADERGARHLIVDLSEISSSQSGCLGPFVGAVSRLKENGGHLVFEGAPASLIREIGIAKLSSLFHCAENRDDAIRFLDSKDAAHS